MTASEELKVFFEKEFEKAEAEHQIAVAKHNEFMEYAESLKVECARTSSKN
jgi:hypothetical protein